MNEKLIAEIAQIIMKFFPDMATEHTYRDCAIVILDLLKRKEDHGPKQ